MNTRVIAVDPEQPDPEQLREAADLLVRGRLVAFPTETVYGLGANALDRAAVDRIFAAKGRPASDPLIVHIYSTIQLADIAVRVPDVAWELAHAFWPGPLTLVLPKQPRIPSNVSAGLETVAVRMPNHKVPHVLFRLADRPIVAPSANLFSRPSPTTAQHVLDDLGGRIDVVIDAGPTPIGVESTVVDVTGETPVILRPGGLPLEALRQVIPDVRFTPRYVAMAEESATPSPGMMIKHYSPSAEVLLFSGETDLVRARMRDMAKELTAAGKSVGVMAVEEERPLFVNGDVHFASLGSQRDLAQVAHNLFASMRQLERAGVDVILARTLAREGLGLAVWDRLVRATEGRVIEM